MTDGVQRARELLDDAARRLRAAGVPDEALGEYAQPKAVLGIRREATMRPLGRVWRIGALLIGSSLESGGRVWATGAITRVIDPGRAQFQSVSAEVRRAYRAAAVRPCRHDSGSVGRTPGRFDEQPDAVGQVAGERDGGARGR